MNDRKFDLKRRLGKWPLGRILAAAAISAVLLMISFTPQYARAGSDTLFQRLSGEWSGWGWIETATGDRERIRCQITYKLSAANRNISQVLRCASANYNIDGSTDLKNDKGRIAGKWREKTYNAEGEVTGQVTSNYMSLALTSTTQTISVSVTTPSKCRQALSIKPDNSDIKKITVNFKRC